MAARTIFVISPIGSPGTPEHRRYRSTLEYIVKKAFVAPDWEVVRADEETSPDSITTQVIGRIVESDMVIADLTDHNPNVFYELAVAHGYQKPVIHLMQAGQKVPFDVVDQRVIFYDLSDPESVDKARLGLIGAAKWLDENPSLSRNPLAAYGQFSAISSASGGGGTGEAVADAISQLARQVARLDAQIRVPRWERASLSATALQAELILLMQERDKLRRESLDGSDAIDEMADLEIRIAQIQARIRDHNERYGDGS